MSRFNTILCLLAVLAWQGCSSLGGKDKPTVANSSTIRLHIEAFAGLPGFVKAPIMGNESMTVTVSDTPFITEINVLKAQIWDGGDGRFAINLVLDRRGRLILENVSASNRGKRVAVYCQFPEGKWIAAPRLDKLHSSGMFLFAPEVDRIDAQRIVDGLNRIAKHYEKDRDELD